VTVTTESRPPGIYPKFDDSITDWALHESKVDWEVVPFSFGPTWDRNPFWTGPRDPQGYILPELTLGWQILKWIEENLLAEETDDNDNHLPFDLTDEQKRFILWFYAIDETGRFLYREVVLQRLKGHGKDPLAAVIAAVEFVGPCRFAGWATRKMDDKGLLQGDPVAKPHPRAWIQVAAVSLEQTKNTMKIFNGLFTPACIAEHGIDMGKEKIYAYGGQKAIEAVTSSPKALEGNRPTLVIKNETHHWQQNNEGIAMAEAIERNATKSKGGAARTFSITNAFEPSIESVARDERDAYEKQQSGEAINTGMLYDTLEAPKDARLRPLFPSETKNAESRGIEPLDNETEERITRLYIKRILEAVRGGAWWLDIPGLTNSILSPKSKISLSRRFWYNQVVANEDAWADPAAIDAAISLDVKSLRHNLSSPDLILEAGWQPVSPNDQVVAFFDGSKSDDSTAIVGCRLSDGYCFLIGVWQKPKGEMGKRWLAPRAAVDRRVDKMFERFNVVAFWGDPSHAKDDEEDESSYWMPMLDKWMRKYKDPIPGINHKGLDPKHWPVKSGLSKHAINWDMSGADKTKAFIAAAEQTVEDLENINDVEEFEPTFMFDGHPVLVAHMKNAIEHIDPRGWGISLAKEQKDSPRKIDAAVCLVGARMLRRIVLNLHEEEETDEPGEIWGSLISDEEAILASMRAPRRGPGGMILDDD
jgi:hypothetical protein